MNRRVVLFAQVKGFVRRLAPEPRQRVRQALDGLAVNRGEITSLEENLEGYQRLRVGKYRILYRYGEKDEILCVFMEARPTVYQLFAEARDLIDPL